LFSIANFSNDLSYHGQNGRVSRTPGIWIDIEDRNAFAPLNLARTRFSASDEDIEKNIDDYLFLDFTNFLRNNSAKILGSSRSAWPECFTKFERSDLFCWQEQLIPLDHHLIAAYDIKSIIGLSSSVKNIESLIKEFPDIPIGFFAGTPSNMTDAIHRIRSKGNAVNYRIASYACLTEKSELLDAVRNNKNIPKWMMQAIDKSEEIYPGLRMVEIGDRDASSYKAFRSLLDFTGSANLEMYSSRSRALTRSDTKEAKKGAFVDRWLRNRPDVA
jgi:hypothetical protein